MADGILKDEDARIGEARTGGKLPRFIKDAFDGVEPARDMRDEQTGNRRGEGKGIDTPARAWMH